MPLPYGINVVWVLVLQAGGVTECRAFSTRKQAIATLDALLLAVTPVTLGPFRCEVITPPAKKGRI